MSAAGKPDIGRVIVREDIVLDKFEGDPLPENLFERVHVRDGKIWKYEYFQNGELTAVREIGGNDGAN
jgi:hypothetical protein